MLEVRSSSRLERSSPCDEPRRSGGAPKVGSPSRLNRGATFQAASSSRQLNFLEFNRFRGDCLTHPLTHNHLRPRQHEEIGHVQSKSYSGIRVSKSFNAPGFAPTAGIDHR